MKTNRRWLARGKIGGSLAALVSAGALFSCNGAAPQSGASGSTGAKATGSGATLPENASLEQVAISRNLNPEEARNALETYIPPGKRDEFTMFMSGGHSGSTCDQSTQCVSTCSCVASTCSPK